MTSGGGPLFRRLLKGENVKIAGCTCLGGTNPLRTATHAVRESATVDQIPECLDELLSQPYLHVSISNWLRVAHRAPLPPTTSLPSTWL